ncbi:MAG: putative Ig domain-containing protein [Woeseiaceae bacterium]
MTNAVTKKALTILGCVATGLLSGCFEIDDSDGSSSSAFAEVRSPSGAVLASLNTAPKISGRPSRIAVAGRAWSFTPSATDSDGDSLTFTIANRPNWAQFNSTNGHLSGEPSESDEGNYSNIRISVSDGDALADLPAFSVIVKNGLSNNSPSIAGTPPISAVIGQAYTFTPTADDVDGDSLTFAIANKPGWAIFDAATGELSGTPAVGDSSVYNNIVISVSDGELIASLPPFAINVTQVATNSVMLTWVPPTENEDGTALTNLAAYKIYYGQFEGNYPSQISIDNPGLTSHLVENLPPNTYYFVATSINSTGLESDFSNVVVKTLN